MEVIKETLWKRCLCTPTKPPAKIATFASRTTAYQHKGTRKKCKKTIQVAIIQWQLQFLMYKPHHIASFASPDLSRKQAKTSDISKQSPSPLHLIFLLGRARFTAQPTPNLYPPCSYREFARYCECWLDVLTAGQGERRCSPKRLI